MVRHFAFAIALLMPVQATGSACDVEMPIRVLNSVWSAEFAVVGYGAFQPASDPAGATSDIKTNPHLPQPNDRRFFPKSQEKFYRFSGVLFEGEKIVPVDQHLIKEEILCRVYDCGSPFPLEHGIEYLTVFNRNDRADQLLIARSPCNTFSSHKVAGLDLNKASRCLSQGNCGPADLGF